jgi:teichuronic acid exporter
MDLNSRIRKSLTWGAVGLVLNKFAAFAAKLIIARFLAPEEFGTFSIALIYVSLTTVLAQLGLKTALIQSRQDFTFGRKLSSAFWFLIANSLFTTLIALLLLPIFVDQFEEKKSLYHLTLLLLPAVFISSAGLSYESLLERRLRFQTLVKIEFASNLTASIFSVAAVLGGWGIYALVIQHVLALLVKSILVWTAQAWRPRFEFSVSLVRGLLGFSMPVAVNSLLMFARSNIDKLIVAVLLGTGPAGLYALAILITDTLRNQAALVVDRVMLPSYSKMASNPAQVRVYYLRVVAYYSLVFFPTSALIATFADELIAIFGPQWLGSAAVLKILAVGSAIYASGGAPATVLTSLGYPNKVTRISFLNLVLFFIPTVALAAYLGDLQWVAVAVVAHILILRVLYFVVLKPLLGLRVGSLIHAQLPGFLLGAALIIPAFFHGVYFIQASILSLFASFVILMVIFRTQLGFYIRSGG